MHRFFSELCGTCQRLPNGNTLITESTRGRAFEVTPDKEIVWEFVSPFYYFYRSDVFGINNFLFRAYRYGPDYEGLKGRSLDPGRFEWVLKEKGKPLVEEPEEKRREEVKSRLKRLGY